MVGIFDWSAGGKFQGFTEVDRSYGFSYWERFRNYEGVNIAYIIKARLQLLRDFGSCLSPLNAFLFPSGVGNTVTPGGKARLKYA